MQTKKLLEYWKNEETRIFQGWDFSSLSNFMEEGELPWNYRSFAKDEFFPILSFSDVGAFVYFAKIIEWEFPGFSVERYQDKLFELQKEIQKKGYFELVEHRFFIKAVKV